MVQKGPAVKVPKGNLEEANNLIEYANIVKGVGVIKNPSAVTSIGSDKVALPAGALVYGKLDPNTGRTFITPEKGSFIASTEFVPLQVDSSKLKLPFLQKLLLLPDLNASLGLLKSGKCQQRADLDKLRWCKLPIPSLETQEAYLAQVKERWEKLEEQARSVPTFQEIVDRIFRPFVEFRAPDSKLVDEIPAKTIASSRLIRNGYRYLTMSHGFELMLSDAGETVPLNKLAKVRGGKRLAKGTSYSLKPTGYSYLRGSDIGNGRVKSSQVVSISATAFSKIERFKAIEGDIAISIAGVVGKVALLKLEEPLGVTENISLIRVRDEKRLLPEFLMYLLLTSWMQFQMKKEMSELRQQKLSLEKLRALRIPSPPSLREQEDILATIREEFDAVHEKLQAIHNSKTVLDNELRAVLGLLPESPSAVAAVEVDAEDDPVEDEAEELTSEDA